MDIRADGGAIHAERANVVKTLSVNIEPRLYADILKKLVELKTDHFQGWSFTAILNLALVRMLKELKRADGKQLEELWNEYQESRRERA